MTGAGLSLTSISKSFPRNGAGPVVALDHVDLEVAAGEFVVIVGHNGSGKSTLLNVIFGDQDPDSGTLRLLRDGGAEDFTATSRRERAAFMARVHQDPTRGTVPSLTLWENLRLADPDRHHASPFAFGSARKARQAYEPLLAPLGLVDKLEARASELSAGQRQLAALLLAVLRRPLVLLLDEHTASLDSQNSALCMEKAVELSRRTHTTVLAVTHDMVEALEYGDRLVVLRDGRVGHEIGPEEKASLSLERLLELCGYSTPVRAPGSGAQ